MSGITVTVDASAVLAMLGKAARGMSPAGRLIPNKKISTDLDAWVQRNFATEGRLWSPAGWEPLKPSTLIGRARKIAGKGKRSMVRKLYRQGKTMAQVGAATKKLYGGPLGQAMILQDTSAMRKSFEPFFDADQGGIGTQRDKEHADLSEYHQEGNRARNLPRRPMLPSREQAAEIGVQVYRLHVAKMVRGQA